MQSPIRVPQKRSSQQRQIRFPGADYLIGLQRFRDHPNGGGQQSRFLANAIGKGSLVTGSNPDFCVWNEAAGRTIDQIDAECARLPAQFDRVFQLPSTLGPILSGDAEKQR